jgi:hypothetical protein
VRLINKHGEFVEALGITRDFIEERPGSEQDYVSFGKGWLTHSSKAGLGAFRLAIKASQRDALPSAVALQLLGSIDRNRMIWDNECNAAFQTAILASIPARQFRPEKCSFSGASGEPDLSHA